MKVGGSDQFGELEPRRPVLHSARSLQNEVRDLRSSSSSSAFMILWVYCWVTWPDLSFMNRHDNIPGPSTPGSETGTCAAGGTSSKCGEGIFRAKRCEVGNKKAVRMMVMALKWFECLRGQQNAKNLSRNTLLTLPCTDFTEEGCASLRSEKIWSTLVLVGVIGWSTLAVHVSGRINKKRNQILNHQVSNNQISI